MLLCVSFGVYRSLFLAVRDCWSLVVYLVEQLVIWLPVLTLVVLRFSPETRHLTTLRVFLLFISCFLCCVRGTLAIRDDDDDDLQSVDDS